MPETGKLEAGSEQRWNKFRLGVHVVPSNKKKKKQAEQTVCEDDYQGKKGSVLGTLAW